MQAGIAVSGDGWIPIFHRAYDGGAAEVSQIVGAMSELKKMAGSARFLLAGDSKLISHGNVGAMIDAGVQFSRPGRRSEDPAGVPCRAKSTP